MIQVHPVADLAEAHQRPHRQHRVHSPRHLQRPQQQTAHHGDERQRTLIGRPAATRQDARQGDDHRQGGERGMPSARRHDAAAPHPARQQGADQDLGQARRCGPVRRIGTPHHGDQRRGHCEHRRERRHRAEHRPAPPTAASGEHHEHRRPHPVELLLDRQRPEVLERRHTSDEQFAVARLARQAHPVEDLQGGTDDVGPQALDPAERPEPAGHHHQHQAQQAGRQQPPEAPSVEGTERHPTRAVVLGEQQPRDQEPGQREEHRHAQIAGGHPREPGMEDHHEQHRHRTQTVERGLVRGRAVGHGVSGWRARRRARLRRCAPRARRGAR